jgi:hypothetical protein
MKSEPNLPISGAAHVERGIKVDAQVQKAQATRRTQFANVKPERPAHVQRPKSKEAAQSYNKQGR